MMDKTSQGTGEKTKDRQTRQGAGNPTEDSLKPKQKTIATS